MSKILELAKKLKELADRGIGGEKNTAEAMLNALLKKHKISIEEIEGDKLEDYFFTLKNNLAPLWGQIVKHVDSNIKRYGEFPAKLVKKHLLKGNYMISCTASQYIEIESKYSFYEQLYNEELKYFYSAFIKANNLLIDNPNKPFVDAEDLSEEDYERYKRIDDLSKKIKVGQFRKQLS